ncbi:hypothetical protein WQQ_03600 [Hydrocarboniphaga effusa AP103]|uniref:Uncharacterized protein n=1 Tax=Hydrocarboniphaga effusa AP103 TaxID=1172194 RepID=I8I2F9_9GAMM|nr:hypothetical protein WQQ_01730 [Hydrocarboniphaga effusa AP103]EIT70223.1 hypothetical protein WQQ_03600 [Hydrocarboniphaga effusa AP103]
MNLYAIVPKVLSQGSPKTIEAIIAIVEDPHAIEGFHQEAAEQVSFHSD